MINHTTSMSQSEALNSGSSLSKQLLNKVPEITIFFWVIKVLCTTVGETAADFLNVNLNFGLTGTSEVTGILLAIALVFQFKTKKYIPSIYWLSVVLISVFGTLVTDNITDSLGVPLETSTIFFSLALAVTFAVWYAKEKTLSVHAIFTGQREVFYWLAILFTFALGTAAGDLMAEGLGLGYLLTGIIISVTVAILAGAWRLGLNSILAFWLIYIMTRPLGASLGDFLSQSPNHGGLGWGATMTSVVFLTAILGVVTYLSVTKMDVIKKEAERERLSSHSNVFMQTAFTLGILVLIAGIGYYYRQSSLQGELTTNESINTEETTLSDDTQIVVPVEQVNANEVKVTSPAVVPPSIAPIATSPKPTPAETSKPEVKTSPLGDLSSFKVIAQDTLKFVQAGKPADAKERIGDLEYEWDNAEAMLKRIDGAKWIEVDDAIDAALRAVRALKPDAQKSESALKALLETLS